jgi:hypothetical protein
VKETDLAEFSKLMYGMSENFYGELTEGGLNLRFEALKEFELYQISAACTWLVSNQENKYFPTTAIIKKKIIDLSDGKKLPVRIRAEMEADKVIRILRQYGRDQKVQWLDPCTAHLMKHRWPYNTWAAKVTEDDLTTWWKKEFVNAYVLLTEGKEIIVENKKQEIESKQAKKLVDNLAKNLSAK